ncbi:hypothetical protein OY671_010560, partial [Metschnikowia pulcherrima]
FVLTEGESERGPAYRISAAGTDFGAAWKKTARETGREYLSVKSDDPSFPAPIYASSVEDESGDSHTLIWSRRNNDCGQPLPTPRHPQRGFAMFMSAAVQGLRRSGCTAKNSKVFHPDHIVHPASARCSCRWLTNGSALARDKRILRPFAA